METALPTQFSGKERSLSLPCSLVGLVHSKEDESWCQDWVFTLEPREPDGGAGPTLSTPTSLPGPSSRTRHLLPTPRGLPRPAQADE